MCVDEAFLASYSLFFIGVGTSALVPRTRIRRLCVGNVSGVRTLKRHKTGCDAVYL
jgi:hypothetical protein